jgi:DNA-directed RNA polymerase specialized sigma24 family protein
MVSHVLSPEPSVRQLRLSDHDLRQSLVRFASKKLPDGDAEDIVQDTLTDALAAPWVPEDPVELRKWVFGIARRKVADHIARLPRRHLSAREHDGIELPLGELDAIELVRWARSEVEGNPEDVRTLGWMVREGLFGDKLASIAVETGLPAARVRQRVSRLRRTLRQRWAAQVGFAIAVVVLAMAWWGGAPSAPSDSPQPDDGVLLATPARRATSLRQRAEVSCRDRNWAACESNLDEAKTLDPDGERSERVVQLREMLERAVVAPRPTTSGDVSPPESLQQHQAPKPHGSTSPSGGATPPCVCPEYDPMCGCLPGMGRSVVPPDP